MSHRFGLVTFVGALCLGTAAMAQQPPAPPSANLPIAAPQQTPPPPAAPPSQRPAPPAPPAPPPAAMREPPTAYQNIKLDLTLTDTSESAGRKTVSLIAVDNRSGRIRSNASSGALLNVDARPSRTPDGRIVVELTIQYHPKDSERGQTAVLDETMTVALIEGKPMIVSQSSDASGDRKVTVELTATVIK